MISIGSRATRTSSPFFLSTCQRGRTSMRRCYPLLRLSGLGDVISRADTEYMLASQPLDTHPPLDLAAFRDPAPSPARTHRAQALLTQATTADSHARPAVRRRGPSITQTSAQMLAAAGLRSMHTPPDGACFYWSTLLATSDHRTQLALDPALPVPRATFRDIPHPLTHTSDAAEQLRTAMRRLRERATDWLLDPAHRRHFEDEPM